MSFTDNYLALRKKKKKTEEASRTIEAPLFVNKTAALYAQDDIAPVKTTSKKEYTNLKSSDDIFRSDREKEKSVAKTILGEEEETSMMEHLGLMAMKGLSDFNAGVSSTLALLEKPYQAIFPGAATPLGDLADYYKKSNEEYTKRLEESKKSRSTAEKILTDVGSRAVAAVPQAIAALMSGGASLGAQGAALGATTGTGIVATVGTALKTLAKNPLYWTSITQTLGTDYEEAKKNGASETEAITTAIISSSLNAGVEVGGGTEVLPERLKKGGASAIYQWVKSALEEGREEVVQGVISGITEKSIYDEDKELFSIEDENAVINPDRMAQEFGMGAAVGGVLGGGQIAAQGIANAVQENEAKKLTENEQKVVDKEYENRIAEEEQGGKKLTAKEKSKIYDAVVSDMEKGYISTDTIEEVLGGKTYEDYSNTVLGEDTIFNEYEELGKKKDATLAEQTRYKELHELIPEIKKESQREQLKSRLGEEVFGLVKGDRLVESYNERAKRGQAFEADLTQYDEKQQETIKKAAESGILNNTRRTHEFVDMIAKISADKGVLFDFTDNQKLKDSGFAIDGKEVNGYVTKDGITLNVNSAKALNSVVGHEITHVLEGTELYTELQNVLKTYAESKGEYQSRYDTLSKLYEGVKDANIDAELTADLVGDYLFTDSDFINNLSTNNRNVFQKIYDEVKYLCKVATAGSKEARELEKVKRAFEKAYKEGGKVSNDTKYSVSDGKDFKLEDYTIDDILKWSDEEFERAYKELGLDTWLEMDEDVPLDEDFAIESASESLDVEPETIKILFRRNGLGNSHVEENRTAVMTQERIDKRIAEHGAGQSDYARRYITRISPKDFIDMTVYERNMERDKFDSNVRGDLDSKMGDWDYNKQLRDSEEPPVLVIDKSTGQIIGHNGRHRVRALEMAGIESVEIEVELHDEEGYLIKYNAQTIPDMAISSQFDTAIETHLSNIIPLNKAHRDKIVAHYGENAHANAGVKYSISDSNGKQLSKEQQDYFKDSKVRDENGNLLKVYHGSKNSGFNVFQYSEDVQTGTDYGEAYYFTSDRQKASGYSYDVNKDERVAQYKKEKDALLNKFLQTRSEEDKNAVLNYTLDGKSLYDLMGDESYLTNGGEVKEVYLNLTNPLTVDAGGKYYYEVYPEYFEQARANGNDGIIVKNVIDNPRGEARPIDTYIAFKPEQIKNTDNLNPTADKDIRYSLSEKGEAPIRRGNYNVFGKDIALETVAENATVEESAPVVNAENATTMFPDDLAPMDEAYDADRLASLEDADAPPEMEAPVSEEVPFRNGQVAEADDPFADREVPYGNEGKKVKAYMYENPEVKPFFQEEAYALLEELNNGTKGERWYNDKLYYDSGGEEGWGGTKRHQSESIDRLTYEFDLSYEEIEKGLNAIIEDNGAENIAAAKKIEFVINDRLMYGYKPFGSLLPPEAGRPNQDYIALMQNKQRVDSLADDAYAPPVEDAPIIKPENVSTFDAPTGSTPPTDNTPHTAPVKEQPERVAKIRKADPKKEGSWWSRTKEKFTETKRKLNDVVSTVGDKGWVFENLGKKTGNREVESKYDFMKNRVKGQAQEYLREHLLPIYERIQEIGEQTDTKTVVEVNGETVTDYMQQLEYYAYHLHNIDRMSLDTEAERIRREEIRKQLDGYTEKQIQSIASEKITRNTPKDRVNQIYLAQEYIDLGGAKGKNKAVFGSSVTADVSRKKVAEYEAAHPEFKELEQAILDYNTALREYAVSQGLITRKVADKWAKIYPHYVPIRRTDRQGASVSVPLDSNRTGVNNPFKRAQGGNSDFEPMLDAMAMNTEQIFYAVARNDFGKELMGALETSAAMDAKKSVDRATRQAIIDGGLKAGTRVKAHDRENIGTVKSFNPKTGKYRVFFENQAGHSATVELGGNILTPLHTQQRAGKDVDASEMLESTEANDNAVLEPGKNGQPPQFTVFVNGKPVSFDITEEMYKAMKPAEGILSETYAIPNALASGYKKVLTQYDPFFALFRNPIKDTTDVLFNSQHAAATYMAAPKTMMEIATKGKYYTEYIRNGGKTTSYYDTKNRSFTDAAERQSGFPWNAYNRATENVEMFWRLSEYIASREAGRSEKVAMLDAARVTTNFGAGGDLTKWANRNGALFLNPSVQGAMQIGRNVREAYNDGLKGCAILAAKVLATGLGGMFFNWLLWGDDEEYEELSDYVKQNYFVVWKTEDGKFVRIPKGRMQAVIMNGFEQMENLITGDDEVDMATFVDLVMNNLAPNNPLENNLFSPILQAKRNETWYGEDLVPTRLQDVPAAEQYDESTDSISKWVGEKAGELGFDISPYKLNYVMQQYGGGFADVALPMFTPEAEGDSLLAPIKDEIVSDPTMKNQNVSDFYDKVDELTKNANSIKATDEDILMSKYMNSVNSEMSELYKKKREIQNSSLSDSAKYSAVREVQEQIVELTRESLNSYEDVFTSDTYATVADRHFRRNKDGEWEKITDKQLEKQEEVTSYLSISPTEYWGNKEEYDYAYEYPEKYAVAKSVGGYEAYKEYSSALYDIKADKDEDGKSITGSRKKKVIDWLNGLDADYYEKLILFKSEYNADDTYNYEIIDYLNSREDISYKEMETILKELGFTVSNGNISW